MWWRRIVVLVKQEWQLSLTWRLCKITKPYETDGISTSTTTTIGEDTLLSPFMQKIQEIRGKQHRKGGTP